MLYRFELAEYVVKYSDGKYMPMCFPMYVPLNDTDHTSKDFIREQKIINKYIEKYSKEKNCKIVSSCSCSFNIPRMFSYDITYNNLYNEKWYKHRYSYSRVKEYFKYKSCYKKHKDDLIFFKERDGEFIINNGIGSSLNEGYEIDVAICNRCNIAFNLTDINKGFKWALKSDMSGIISNINDMWFIITIPIYRLTHRKIYKKG